MTFDRIEWDEANLDHATVRVAAAEIEQAIWNADGMVRHREHPDRLMIRSVTDGGRGLVVVAQIVRAGCSADHCVGGGLLSKASKTMTEAQLARRYDETRDLSGFDSGTAESVEVRRNVTISVRFSDEEIALLRERAEGAGTKVTAYIRAAALQQAAPVDRVQVIGLLEEVSADVARAERLMRATP